MDVPCATALSRLTPIRHLRSPSCDRTCLTVVIVNYLRWDDTARLVGQLRRSTALKSGRAEIVIVDNHSPPHGLMKQLRQAEGVSLRRWSSNRGFARAVNEGSRLGRGNWILLLNPDTSVPNGFLDDLLTRIEHLSDKVGIVGYRLRNEDGSKQLSTGVFPSIASTLVRLLLPRSCRKYSMPVSDQVSEVDWVTGCCLLVRRDCLTAVGGLDPDFFLYYEDVDFCRRAHQLGWIVQFDPSLAIVHHRPLHNRIVSPHLRFFTRHALLTYARKHWTALEFGVLARIIQIEALTRTVLAGLQGHEAAQTIFAELYSLAGDFLDGNTRRARQRLKLVVRHQESQSVRSLVHRDTVASADRSAARVSGECVAVRPA